MYVSLGDMMVNKKNVMISFQERTLMKMDEHRSDIGAGATRSGFVNEAVEYYLKIRRGFRGYKTLPKK